MASDVQKQQYESFRNDTQNWKAGGIYYNEKDLRLFVPKRQSSRGWTLNFGNPTTYLLIVSLLIILMIGMCILKHS